MIAYSSQSQRAYAAIYRPYNDIDIYVEDRSLIGLYERVFSRILSGMARVTSVIPLDGRDAVIQEAKRLRKDRTRKRFFLIDGDFFWITQKPLKIRNLHTLNCYCLENLAFDHAEFIQVAHSLSPGKTATQIDSDFAKKHADYIAKAFWPLFEIYAASHILGAGCQTVSFSPFRLLDPKPAFLPNKTKIRIRIREVLKELRSKHSWQEITNAKKSVRAAATQKQVTDARFISGKYLTSSVHRWFQKEANFSGNQGQLISMILFHSSFSIDPRLPRALKLSARRL